MKSQTLRHTWALFAGALIFAASSSARAQDSGAAGAGGSADECQVDTDCPGDKSCGGPVCSWTASATHHTCVPAGTGPKKGDGWCNGMDTDCKCASVGAKCNAPYCSFTLAADAPAGAGTGGAGGGAADTTTGSGGTAAPSSASSDSGGCAVARMPGSGLASAGLLVGLGAIAFGARRRRRAA